MLCLLLLTACGGGGGGGSSSNGFSISLQSSSVAFELDVGTTPAAEVVMATVSGAAPDPLFVSAVAEGTGIDATIPVTLTGSQASIALRPAAGLAAGTYNGRVLLFACTDQACARRVGGTPLVIAYSVKVRPRLAFSPNPVELMAISGESVTRTVAVQTPVDGAGFVATLGAQDWLAISRQTTSSFDLVARALPPGNYETTLSVTSGAQSVASTITYQVNPPPLQILAAVSGQSTSSEVTAPLAIGASSYVASVAAGTEWLSILEQVPGRVRLQARSLPIGTYQGAVLILSGGTMYSREVEYRVSAPPGGERELAISPASATLSTVEGASSNPVSLNLVRPSWNPPLQMRVTYGVGAADWLAVTATQNGYTLVADGTNLRAGSYVATLTVDPGFPRSPVNVPVALTVGVGFVRPANVMRIVDSETTGAQLPGSIAINVVTGPVAQWTASVDVPWLTITRGTGNTGSNFEYTLDVPALNDAANFSAHTAQVTITPSRATMTPVSFAIQVDKRVTEVNGIGPFYLVSGQVNRVIVRGRGFSRVTDLAARLRVGQAAATAVQLVNDTEITATLPALSAGTHAVSINNALALTAAQRSLTAIDPRVESYASVVSGGELSTFVFDAKRSAIYGVNTATGSLQRFRRNGSTWTRDSASIEDVLAVGLFDLGSSLAVLTGTGTLVLVDPDALTEQARYTEPDGFLRQIPPDSLGVAVTNDGRAYIAAGEDPFGELAFFDPATNTFGRKTAVNFSTGFRNGPWFAMSRNGERLLIPQSGTISPTPPMLYLDAADATLLINPAGIDFFNHASLSDDGSRVLFDRLVVHDREFQFVGRTTLPDTNYFGTSQAMSPDGNRAYVLAYHVDDVDLSDREPVATHSPRVYVFDSSNAVANRLPVLGYFELPDYPTCRAFNNCSLRVRADISPDGATLFFAGGLRLLVVPIPLALTPIESP